MPVRVNCDQGPDRQQGHICQSWMLVLLLAVQVTNRLCQGASSRKSPFTSHSVGQQRVSTTISIQLLLKLLCQLADCSQRFCLFQQVFGAKADPQDINDASDGETEFPGAKEKKHPLDGLLLLLVGMVRELIQEMSQQSCEACMDLFQRTQPREPTGR